MFDEHNRRLWENYRNYMKSVRTGRVTFAVCLSVIILAFIYNLIARNGLWFANVLFQTFAICMLALIGRKMKAAGVVPMMLVSIRGELKEARYTGNMERDLDEFSYCDKMQTEIFMRETFRILSKSSDGESGDDENCCG